MPLECFNFDGDISEDLAPCNPDVDGVTSHATCCSLTDVCMASRLCLSTRDTDVGLSWISSCTDKSFKNDTCPQYCFGECPCRMRHVRRPFLKGSSQEPD